MVQGAQPGRVFFPTPDHLRKHLAPTLDAWIEDWRSLLASAGSEGKTDGRGLVSFSVSTAKLPIEGVKEVFGRLVERLRTGRAGRRYGNRSASRG